MGSSGINNSTYRIKTMSVTMKPAQKVGGVRQKKKNSKNTQQPKPKPVNQPPIDPLLNTTPKIQGVSPIKSPQKQAHYVSEKMKEPKQHNKKKKNNPKINQPKQGY